MSRRKQPLPFFEKAEITDAAAEGKSITRIDERVIFVPFSAPGDIVDIQVYKKKIIS